MNKTIQVPLSEEDINTLKAGDYVFFFKQKTTYQIASC